MNPYARYRQQAAPAQTRIDSLLSLFDAACERAEKAAEAISQTTMAKREPTLTQCHLALRRQAP